MSRYGDWFREERKKEQGAASPSTAGTAAGGRRRSLAAIDAQAAQTRSQLQQLADGITARQGGQSPLERLAGEMAAAPAAPQLRDTLRQGIAAAQEIGRRRAAGTASAAKATLAPYLSGGSGRAQPLQASGLLPGRMVTSRAAGPSPYQRIGYGIDAAISGLAGSIGSALETGKAALGGEVDFLRDTGLKDLFTAPMNELGAKRQSEPYQRQMDMDSAAAKLMQRSAEKTQAAVEGLGPVGQWVGENLISVGQNLPAMAAAAIPVVGPAVSGGIMAAGAGGGKAYELQQQGADAGDAFWRGAVSGGIELATEKFSIDNFLEIAKGVGAKNAVKNILRQAGVEASEESASYILNYIADKAARDPNAEFSLAELANSAAGGALSGGIFGGVGTVVNALGTNGQKNYQYLKERDGGKTPDFDRQYQHYYNQARAGLAEDKIAPYPTQTPLDEPARQSALYAGENDGKAEAAETVQTILDVFNGKTVSDKALDRALSFPESRRAIEDVTGKLPETPSQARKAVRDWIQKNHSSQNSAETMNTSVETSEGFTSSIENEQTQNDKDQGYHAQHSIPGLVRDQHSAHLDPQTADTLDRIVKKTGVSVAFSDTLRAAGEYRDGTITIRSDTENPVRRVFMHELTHHLETSGDYQAFSDMVAKRLEQEGKDVELLQAGIIKEYQRHGEILSEDGARREMVAQFAEERLFTDERSIRRLAQEDRSLARRILDWVQDTVVKLAGSAEERFLRRAEQSYIHALESAEGRWSGETQHKFLGYDEKTGRGRYQANFPKGTPKSAKSQKILSLIQNVWSKQPIPLRITKNGETRTILAQFDPTVPENTRARSDATKLAGGNKIGNAGERRVAMDLTDDYPRIIKDSTYDATKPESGKQLSTHEGVKEWHYFVNDILVSEFEGGAETPYRATINIKEKEDGNFVYSFSVKQQEVLTPDSIDTAMRADENASANVRTSENSITQDTPDGKEENGDFVYSFAVREQPESTKKEAPAPGGMRTDVRAGENASANARTSDNSITYDTPDGKKKASGGQKSYGGSLSELNERLAALTEEEQRVLKEENQRQQQKIERLEKQLSRTPPEHRSETQVRKMAEVVLADYASRADRKRVTAMLQQLCDETHKPGVKTERLYSLASDAAVEIVQNSRQLHDEMSEQYQGLRRQLRET